MKDGALDLDAIKALHDKASTDAERVKDIPADGTYTIALPDTDEFKGADGKPLEMDTNAPSYQTLLDAAKSLKLTNAEVNEIAAAMVRRELEAEKAEAEARTAQVQAELAKLGADPKARTTALSSALTAQLGEEDAKALAAGLTTAAAVIATEKLIAKLRATTPNPPPADVGKPTKSAAQIIYGVTNKAA